MVPLLLISQTIVLSAFPIMCRKYETGIQDLKRVAEKLIGVLVLWGVTRSYLGLFYLAARLVASIWGRGVLVGGHCFACNRLGSAAKGGSQCAWASPVG